MPFRPDLNNNLQILEDARHEHSAFFDAMDEVFFSVDILNSKVIQISKGCDKLYGLKPEEFLANNRLWYEMIHPDDKHIVADEDEILQRGEVVNKQYRIIRADGEIRWVENKIVPGFDETGRWVRIDGITWDITKRKEADEKQQQEGARFRQIVETSQEGIWTIDENNKTNFVNKKICEILGYTPEEMIGKELFDFMDAEDQAFGEECIARRRAGIRENVDTRYKTKQGKHVWTNISANPIFDENGRYKGSLAMVTDITDRKLDEDALKKSEANLRTIFEHTDSAYVLIDSELRIVSFNSLAQKYSEQQNQKPLEAGRGLTDYFSEQRLPYIKSVLEKAATEGMAGYELTFTDSNGDVKWHHIRWINVKNSDGKTCGFILSNKDITAAKMAALERERIAADLIQHIKDLEQFTYIISHNLRAPVANIMGLSEMLSDPTLEEDLKNEAADRVSLSIKNIDTIIKDLNHILQVRELINEKKEAVYFNHLVDAIKTSIYNTIVEEKVQFDCDFEEVDCLFAIRSYLYSIFYNLTSNSIKYRRPGVAPVISIKSRKLKDKIEVHFKDNGKGIDMEKNGHQIFGLYKRFDTSTEGKGLGLFMVKTQAEALGGTIKIKSVPGKGTEFFIQLPVSTE